MATLVLSTVGTVAGGPIGSAIGALIGQSIDQELLAPVRRGPRVGDLSVQTSSYGTQIPRIYGTMRVAGSVIWSTDLIEHENADGAKGQPDVSYSYTVSLAVALSSRRAKSIKRIWADGKLLRGAAGDFKVGTTFRFYDGSEDQVVDPLIGSVEGIANTPGYRGIALAVFEELELAEFGNRIPFLTFEVEADDGSQTVGAVLTDASAGAISCDFDGSLAGFAAYGRSIKSAIEPLIECYGVDLFDDGTEIRLAASDAPVTVQEDEFGNGADNPESRLRREQLPARSAPATLRLTYYDPSRDYQTGEARAVAGEQARSEAQQELAAVLNATDAKSLAQEMLARIWATRDRLILRLPPHRLSLQPGNLVDLPLSPSRWVVEKLTVEGFVVAAELRPSTTAAAAIQADAGRIASNLDVVSGPVTLALLDTPAAFAFSSTEPTVLLAASTATSGWKPRTVQIGFGGQTILAQTARSKSVLGNSLTVLGAGSTDLIDDQNNVEVQLLDPNQWLTSCDDDALAAGENRAVVGGELLQFGRALSLGAGRFRLSRLLRGRGGTEWACASHGSNELFCLVETSRLQAITLPSWSMGAVVNASTVGSSGASVNFSAEALRPRSPVNLTVGREPNGDLTLSWTRRSRQGFAWVDGIDAPLGEAREQYSVVLSGSLGAIELQSNEPSLIVPATMVAEIGTGSAAVEIRQIGDFAASRPAQVTITIS